MTLRDTNVLITNYWWQRVCFADEQAVGREPADRRGCRRDDALIDSRRWSRD